MMLRRLRPGLNLQLSRLAWLDTHTVSAWLAPHNSKQEYSPNITWIIFILSPGKFSCPRLVNNSNNVNIAYKIVQVLYKKITRTKLTISYKLYSQSVSVDHSSSSGLENKTWERRQQRISIYQAKHQQYFIQNLIFYDLLFSSWVTWIIHNLEIDVPKIF